jgi:hypothetical protein
MLYNAAREPLGECRSAVIVTGYVVACIGCGFCLRQHGTFDLLCSVFPRRARKNRTPTKSSTAAAQRELDFDYRITLAEGTRRIMAWLDRQGSLPNSDNDRFEDQLIATWERLGEDLAGAQLEA